MRLKITVVSLCLLLLLVALPLVAAAKDNKDNKESEHVTFTDPVMVAGTELKPGEYHVTWEGTGPVVQVTFKRGGKVLVTTSARLVNENSPYDGALQMNTMDNKVNVLTGIQWKKKTLMFDQMTSTSG